MGGYTNECGKFFSNPTSENPFGSSPSCSEKEIFEYRDKVKTRINKQKELKANKLQSVAPPRRKGISSGQLMIISACAISVLTYKYSKGNKEFKALLGLLSPFILYYGVAIPYLKYKKQKETQEYNSRGEGFNNA